MMINRHSTVRSIIVLGTLAITLAGCGGGGGGQTSTPVTITGLPVSGAVATRNQ